MEIEQTIKERSETHGNIKDNARVYNALQNAISIGAEVHLCNVEKLSMDMILLKIARIVNGNVRDDSWHDIAGYATLAENSLKEGK